MFQLRETRIDTQQDLYRVMSDEAKNLIGDERNFIANSANIASLIFHMLQDLNWAGFYIRQGKELILGPFQGKPACVRITIGKGVCGTAAQNLDTIVVDDVRHFPGHITCDNVSRSEIVIPLIKKNQLIGVLDIDSPVHSRFDDEDKKGLEALVQTYLDLTDNPS